MSSKKGGAHDLGEDGLVTSSGRPDEESFESERPQQNGTWAGLVFHGKEAFRHVFVRAAEENAHRIIAALTEFGFISPSLTWEDLSTTGRVVQLGYPPLRIDLLTAIDGVNFLEA